MDNLHGQFPDYGGSSEEPNRGEEDEARDLPPASIGRDERRMQVRAYNFWASLLEDRQLPAIESLDPETLGDFGPYSVLLDFSKGIENPGVSHLGEQLGAECGADGAIRWLSDVPPRSLLSRITDHYMEILANQAPIGFEAEFVNQRGITVLYRGILLPFAGSGDAIEHIYGVINWKELADQQTADELLLEIDDALEPRPLQRRDPIELNNWADGPADMLSIDVIESVFDTGGEIPMPFARGSETAANKAEELADCLAGARELARQAVASEDRSHQALYAAIGRAHQFALAAADAPDDFAAIITDSGLAVQDRAPLTPLVKLVFGADYDKTRLTEYATAIAHAQRLEIAPGCFGEYLARTAGGLKAVVAEERRLRRAETGNHGNSRKGPRGTLLRRLREAAPVTIEDLPPSGEEFTLLVARRLETGEIVLVGEVPDHPALLEKAARRLLD
jgi:hypothetical protein